MMAAHQMPWCAVVMALALLTAPAFAEHDGEENTDAVDCNDPVNVWGVRICAESAFERADETLNEVYRTLVQRLTDNEVKRFEHGPDGLPFLRQAERDWLRFRDSWCTYEVSRLLDGGRWVADIRGDRSDMEKLLDTHTGAASWYICLQRLTLEHTDRLRKYLE